eukprot:3208752-Amphidinium_carterae.1
MLPIYFMFDCKFTERKGTVPRSSNFGNVCWRSVPSPTQKYSPNNNDYSHNSKNDKNCNCDN